MPLSGCSVTAFRNGRNRFIEILQARLGQSILQVCYRHFGLCRKSTLQKRDRLFIARIFDVEHRIMQQV